MDAEDFDDFDFVRALDERSARALKVTPHDRVLSAAEFEELLARARGESEEIAQQRELIRWFRARYPTAGARLRYANRRYQEWTRSRR